MKSPCDNCPYFWEEKNRSCRDECESYKEWKGLGKLDDTLMADRETAKHLLKE